jgi:hypothetical protein
MKTAKNLLFTLFYAIVFLPSVYSQVNINEDRLGHNHEIYEDDWYYGVIRNSDFRDLKKVINDRWFESTKMDFAKDAISDNYFTVDQVRELLELFSFESSKLELSKLAYSKTVNNRKYYKLYDVFWFESSVIELNNYINNYR